MIGKKLVNQSIVYGLASLLINGSNFFLIPLYTHYLTAAEYGVISSVTIFTTIMIAFLTMGLNGAVTRFYVEYNPEQFREFLLAISLFQLLTGTLICGLFTYFNGIFLDGLFNNVRYDPFLKLGVWISFFAMFSAIPLAVLQMRSKALQYRIYTTISFVLLTSLMIYFVVRGDQGSLGGVRALLYSNMAMAILYTFYLAMSVSFIFRLEYLKSALPLSLPIMVYAVFGLMIEVSSKFYIERFVSLAELGVFNVAQQISSVILLVTNAINMAWVPIFFEESKRNEKSDAFREFGKILIYCLVVLGLGISMLSKEFVFYFMPPSYAMAHIYIPFIMMIYIIGNGYWVLMINPITFAKKTMYLPLISVLSGSLAIVLNRLLVPYYGTNGAIISLMASNVAQIIFAFFVMKKYCVVSYDFIRMNLIVAMGIIFYLLSSLIDFSAMEFNVAAKILLLGIFVLVLGMIKVYSLNDIRKFLSHNFDII